MSEPQANPKQNKRPNSSKPKRPPLTHFLCLPLINDISLPQLESSLASFKASIPLAPTISTQEHDHGQQQPRSLIPHDAIRPVGTLHLTLGVMSLPTPERLEEALQFFSSLDLGALLRHASASAAQKRMHAEDPRKESAGVDAQEQSPANETGTFSPESDPEPLTISLENIHALQRASSARVLHAAPVDQTSRLYPFCKALRDKFVDAGFIQKENRPLLLHATIANLIYSRGGSRPRSNHGKGKKNQNTRSQTFDARNIVAHYRNFYLDPERTIPRSSGGVVAQFSRTGGNENTVVDAEKAGAYEGHREGEGAERRASNGKDQGHPFVWARDIPIETVSICEMGAKKLDPMADDSGMSARLGQRYMAVAQRSLHP